MWQTIIQWFGDLTGRHKIIKDFNKYSKNAFINGSAPTLLQASISRGNSNFRHSFSKTIFSGFRIKAMSGKQLDHSEMNIIGDVILGEVEMVRQLMSLGWDTFEVHDNMGSNGLQWKLEKYAKLGGVLNARN